MLNHFDASNNKITELTINNCPEISRFHIEDNLLKELSFLDKLDSRKLNFLGLSNNYFPSQDLSIFSRFSNLRELGLRKTNFFGSFRPLINLKKLEGLNVTEAETENDLEYLPDSLKEVAFSHSQNIDKNTENLETSR